MHTFFENGLRFSCTKCSHCCRREPGFVFLSHQDMCVLCAYLHLSKKELIESRCRFVPVYENEAYVSLLENSRYDCIFWNNGCTVYEARPVQCKTYPFWTGFLESQKNWEAESRHCEGMNSGVLHEKQTILKMKNLFEKNERAIFSFDERKKYVCPIENFFIEKNEAHDEK